MRQPLIFRILVANFAAVLLTVTAQRAREPALNPADYKSPSGKFVLNVDPTDIYGRGAGNYQVTSNGLVAWSGEKLFTLYEAGITDEGMIGGFAYTRGLEGFPAKGMGDGKGEFHVVIMRANGDLLLDDIVERQSSRFLHAVPDPVAGGMLIDGAKDQLVVLVRDADLNRQEHSWWTYQLSTGKLVGKLDHGPEMQRKKATEAAAVSNVKLSDFPNQPLKQLGTFTLRDTGPTNSPVIRDVAGFDFDDQGRIGFIRREGRTQVSFVQLTAEGKTLSETSLPIPSDLLTNFSPKTAWLEGDRWVVVVSEIGVGGKAFGWWLDSATGDFNAITPFKCLPIEKIAGTRDGGFVALVTRRMQYSMEDALVAFDKTGGLRWEVKESHDNSESGLFSPEDVTVTTSRRIAVLDNIRKTVQCFDTNGQFLTSLKLEKLWGREPNYPADIVADKDGGLLIEDFHGRPPVVRMDANGKVLTQFVAKHADGRVIDTVTGIKVSPSGHVWTCDRECFARLDDSGVADSVLGSEPAGENLGRIAGVTVDQQGRLYAVDERTGAVHVFDETGTRLRVCKPDPKDFQGKLILANVAVGSDGAVYVSSGMGDPDDSRFVHFAPDGKRIGVKRLGLDSVTEQWFGLPAKEQMLVIGYQNAFLVDRDSKVVRTIQRRPDRKWLDRIQSASVAPDGSFAIVAGGGHWAKESWPASLYDSDGEPVRVVNMPAECMDFCFALAGRYLVTRTETEICVFKATGEPLLKFAPKEQEFKDQNKELWACFATNSGRELWFVSPGSKRVWRFELPD